MAGVATRDVVHAAQVILLYQVLSQRRLLGECFAVHHYWLDSAGSLIPHIENFRPRTQVLFRRAVAIQAPLHLQRSLRPHQGHAVDGSVAGRAPNAFVDVDAVIEIHKIWQLIDARPNERSIGPETRPDRLQQVGVRPDLPVAIHAGLRRRNARKTGNFDRRMTIAAIQPKTSHMVLMAEGHRLLPRYPPPAHIRRALHLNGEEKEPSDPKDRKCQGNPGYGVCAAMKNLGHLQDH